MATLTNTQISVTYVGLLKTSANTVLSSTAQQITDGSGNNSILFLSTAGVGIGGAAASGKELDVTGNVLITGDLIVDNITIDGNTITSASSDFVIDSNGGNIILDSSGGDIVLKDTGTEFGRLKRTGENLIIKSITNDKDIIFKGVDNNSEITALTLDMSEGGNATFNGDITVSGGDITLGGTGRIQGIDTVSASTDAANKAYVDAQIDTVDTLSEILAIGNTTGATKISVNNTSSGIDFIDNAKARFGTGNDLEIYHDENNSVIKDDGTGDLYLMASSVIRLTNVGAGEHYAKFIENGAVELYHDNSKKFETTSAGATITGTINDLTLSSGSIATNTSNNFALNTPNSLRINIDSNNSATDQIFAIGHNQTAVDNSNNVLFSLLENGLATFAGDVTIGGKTYPKLFLNDNQGVARNFSVGTNNETFTVRNETGSADVLTITGADNATTFAGEVNVQGSTHSTLRVKSGNDDNILFAQAIQSDNARVGTSTNTDLSFFTNSSERIRIENTGLVGINYTSPSAKLHIETGSDEGIRIHRTATNANFGAIEFRNSDDTATNSRIGFGNNYMRIEGTDNLQFITNTSEKMRITSGGNVGISQTSPTSNINSGSFFKPDSSGRFVTLNSANGSFIMLESSSTTDDDQIGGVYFTATSGQGDAHKQVAGIDAIVYAHGTTSLNGADLRFFTKPAGAGQTTPALILEHNSNATFAADVEIGVADSGERKLKIHGGASGSSEGGQIELHTAADFDSSYAFYRIDAFEDDFRIGRAGTTDITLQSTGNVVFGGNITVNTATLSGQISVSAGGINTAANLNSTGDPGLLIQNGARLGFDQSGTRSWTFKAYAGNLNLNSGDGNGSFSTGTLGIIAGAGTFGGAVTGTSFSATGGFLNGSNGGIRIHTSGTKFFNVTAANAARDNIMDVGASDARFKDAHFGGTVNTVNLAISGTLSGAGSFVPVGGGTFTGNVTLDNSGSGDRVLTLSTTTGGDPQIVMNSDAANRSGLIKYQDNGTNIGRIEYVHNGDRIDIQAGSASGATMSIKNNAVGIGVTAPSEKLEIVGGSVYVNSENQGFIADNSAKRIGLMKYAGREAVISRIAGQDFEIVRTDGSNIFDGSSLTRDFYVTGAGDVAVGTGTQEGKFTVFGANQICNFDLDANAQVGLSVMGLSSNVCGFTIGKANATKQAAVFRFGFVGDGSDSNYAGIGLYAADDTLVVTGGSLVGIGTNSPQVKFHVRSNAEETIRVDNSGDTAAIHFRENGVLRGILGYSNGSTISSAADADDMILRVEGANKLHLANSGSIALTVHTDEKIGINNLSPTGQLHVVSPAATTVPLKLRQHASTTVESILSITDKAAGTDFYHFVGQSDSSTNRIIIYGNGNIQNSNNSYGQISDENLKENIVDATPKLEDIKKLKVKNFNYKGEDYKQIGMIAQDVEKIFPSLVEEVTDPETKEKHKSLKYSVFVPMLIKSIQELEKRVQELESK